VLYDRVLAEVAATPWAIEPAKGEAIAHFLSRKAAGEQIPRAEIDAAAALRKPAKKPRAGVVALVPLHGVMVKRGNFITEASGLMTTEDVGRAVDAAAADPNVEAIVLDVDSPGGSVAGTPELADRVHAAAKAKKVIAVANSAAASAAYWVAAQAGELVVTPSGQVGSLGVFVMHFDRSEEMRQRGVAVTLVKAGERKAAGHPYGPLEGEARAEVEEVVAGYYDQFVRAVARGRKATLTAVREGFGKGGMVLAEAAVREGMADRVATLDDVLARFGVSLSDVAPDARAEGPAPAAAARPAHPGVEIRKRRLRMD